MVGTATCGLVNHAISKPVCGVAPGAMPTVQKTTSNFLFAQLGEFGKGKLSAVW